MTPNRYNIKAMEIELAHENEGMSYFDLRTDLEKSLGYCFSNSAKITSLS